MELAQSVLWSRRRAVHALGGCLAIGCLSSCGQDTAELPPQEIHLDLANMTAEERVLAQRPFAVQPQARKDFYSTWPTQIFPDSTPSTSLISGEMQEEQATRLLESYLLLESVEMRFECQQLFADPTARTKIPSPILRAAFAVLPTTSGKAAVPFILSDRVTSMKYVAHPVDAYGRRPIEWTGEFERRFATAYYDPARDQTGYVFNPRYQGQNINPFLLTNSIAHEPLHQDWDVTDTEEAIAATFDTLILLEQLSRHDLIDSTEIGRRMATRAALRLNSGLGARLGIFHTNRNEPLIPDSNVTETGWLQRFRRSEPKLFGLPLSRASTTGSVLLGDYCRALGLTDAGSAPRFDDELLRKIDRAPYPSMPPAAMLTAASHLGMEVPVH